MASALGATALALSTLALAQSPDESAASAAWKTAAAVSAAAPPISSPDAKPSPAVSASAGDAPIAENPIPVSVPRAAATLSASGAAEPSNLVPTPPNSSGVPNLSEIPPAPVSIQEQQPAPIADDSQPSSEPNEIATYEQEQSGMPPEQLQSLRDYDSSGEMSTPIGMELREERRTLKSGQEADGLLVVGLKKGSPAAQAGLHAYSNTAHDMITGAAMAGAMFFPPAILLVPALDYAAIGQSYDLIIGVDGTRVRNFLDFQDRMRNLQPGEMVYLSVLRDGKRMQITIMLPPAPPNMTQAIK